MICPNKSLNEWKELEEKFGANVASSLFHRNGGAIPTLEQAADMLKGSKIAQFKKTLRYLGTTTSNSVTDLLPNLFRIVQKVGNDLFVVKGSPIDQIPAPGTEFEIHQANVKFLNAVNDQYGKLFNVEQVMPGYDSYDFRINNSADSIKTKILDEVTETNFNSLYGQVLKSTLLDPATREIALKELIDQANGGEATRAELEKTIGESLVKKIIEYDVHSKQNVIFEKEQALNAELKKAIPGVEGIIKKGGPARTKEVLGTIAGSDTKYSKLAKELLTTADAESLEVPIVRKSSSGSSFYSPSKDKIEVRTDSVNPYIVMHEIMHGLTARKIPTKINTEGKTPFLYDKGSAYKTQLDEYLVNPEGDEDVKGMIKLYLHAADKLGYTDQLFGNTKTKEKSVFKGSFPDEKNNGTIYLQDAKEVKELERQFKAAGLERGTEYQTFTAGRGYGWEASIWPKGFEKLQKADFFKEETGTTRSDNRKTFSLTSEREIKRQGKGGSTAAVSKSDLPYGMSNLDEFVAEAFSNKRFQDELASIPYTKDKNVFQQFIDAVKSLLGLDNIDDSLLGEVIQQGAKIVGRGRDTFKNATFAAEEFANAPEPGNRLFNEPNPETRDIAEEYKKEKHIRTEVGTPITSLDVNRSLHIADAFEAMPHDPNNPEVKKAYKKMAKETIDQYHTIAKAGYKVEIYEGKGEPYKNSEDMIKDVRDNKHQYVLSTEKEFGENPITNQQREENPLLENSGIKDVNGKPLLVNDVFRFVHDFFGHTERGNSFGPLGEENAWDVHARMYTPEARRAMTTETRGQNSWVNFGPHMRKVAFDESKIKSKAVKVEMEGTVHEITYEGKPVGRISKDTSTGWWIDADKQTSLADTSNVLSTENKKEAIKNLVLNNVHNAYTDGQAGDLIQKGEPGYLPLTERPFAQQKIGLLPEEFSTIVADGSNKVTIDQSALDKLAADNAALKPKEDAFEREESLDSNKKILTDKAPRYSKAEEDIAVTTVQYNTLNNLKSKFNLPYEVVNDETLPWKGKFENGKVYINAAKVNEYTPVHEYLHPYMMVMGKDNPELYNRLVEELQSTEEGKKTIEEVKAKYPELAARDQFEEALVTHISKLVSSDEIKSKPWYQTFIDWFKNLFAKNNVSITDLDLRSTIRDIADKIIDPTYSADLKKYGEFNDAAVRFEKDLNADNRTDRFQAVLDKIKNKLKLDVNITPKTKEEEQRKYFSGRQLKALEEGDDVYHAINDYVVSSIINAKKVSEQFDGFKEFYEKRNGNLSKEEMLQGFQTLAQMEQQVVLYNESRLVVDAIRDENPDEYEDNFKILKNRLDGDAKIMNDYHEYGLKLMADWLYPSTKKVIETAIKTGNKQKMPGYDDYLKIKADNPGLSDNEAIERGVKKWLRGQMEHATTDIGFFNSYLNGVLNSKDPISQLVALSLKEEFARNNDKLFRVKNGIKEAVNKTIGKKIFTNNAEHKKFYSQYLRQVESYERTGHDDNGNPIFGYVKRSAFHEPFKYDEYYKAKREMFQKLGVRPNKNDEAAYKSWVASRDKWFDEHSVRVFNDKGELTKTVPHDRYKNPEFARVENDPLFKEIYKHYQDANGRLGKYQMKYGIIPQKSTGAGFFSDLKISKGFKGNIEEFKKHFKESVGAELGNYYAQDIDGKEFKNIPIRYTRMLEDDDLSYNLAQSVADFWESSSKYEAANKLQPMVLTLRSFIEGNSFLKIDQRDAPEIDAKGLKKMGNYVKNISKTKDQANINRQLVDFLNDTIYGESEKKANIKSPFGNLKYLVYKKGDTSANGKPHREYVYSLEDLKKKTGDEKIDYGHFEKGKDKEVGDYVVNLVQNDKILSVNKLSKKLNAASATINLGGNVIAGISHYLRGVAATFIEGTGGKYFNNANWTSAYKDYFKGLVGFDFLEDARGGKGSLVSQHLTHYGTFQGEFLNEYGKHIGQGVANKLFRRSSLFFSIHGAEHMIQTTQMLAAMKHIKVEDGSGKKITLDKAWEIGKDGYRKLKDGVQWSEQQDNNFRDMIQSINKDRGNYSEFDKAAISRLWWGKMLIMFRRHIMNGIKTRWGSEYVDFERGTATQGYYRSFMTSLVSEFNDLRLNGKLHKLSPEEQYHMKKTLADVGMFIMLASVLVPAFRNEDEDKQGWDDYAALFSRRLQMDVSFFYDPLEWKKVVQSPIVTGSTVDKVYDFASQLAVSPSETYEKDGAGYVSGDNKALAKLKKLIPVYRVGMNLQDPQDLLKFYDLKKPITSGK